MEREKFFVQSIANVLIDPRKVIARKNVYCIEGPAFVPLENTVTSIIDVARKNGREFICLTNYSKPSHRLPEAINIHDMLLDVGVPRRVDYSPDDKQIPMFDEESEM